MSGTTTDNLIPYMVDGDDLNDVATIMQALAERVDKLTPMTGRVNVPVTASATGSAAITFPAGKFATAPRVFCTPEASTTAYSAYVSGITTTGATVRVRHNDGTSQTSSVDVQWVALRVDE